MRSRVWSEACNSVLVPLCNPFSHSPLVDGPSFMRTFFNGRRNITPPRARARDATKKTPGRNSNYILSRSHCGSGWFCDGMRTYECVCLWRSGFKRNIPFNGVHQRVISVSGGNYYLWPARVDLSDWSGEMAKLVIKYHHLGAMTKSYENRYLSVWIMLVVHLPLIPSISISIHVRKD